MPALTHKFDLSKFSRPATKDLANDTTNPFTAMIVTDRDGWNKLTYKEFKLPPKEDFPDLDEPTQGFDV